MGQFLGPRKVFVKWKNEVRPNPIHNGAGGHIQVLDSNEKPIAMFPGELIVWAQNEDPAETDKEA